MRTPFPSTFELLRPPSEARTSPRTDRVLGCLVGLAVGDALGASVEFRPHEYLVQHPVREMMGGGTWGLAAGQWTDDTSTALCLAASLITHRNFNPYDQLVRYKWWYRHGYLSSTGQCFDIGNATRTSIEEFERRQRLLKQRVHISKNSEIDLLTMETVQSNHFDVNCSGAGVAGNGALMRLAPVPLFFYRTPERAVDFSGQSARLTHGDDAAVDACRYYGALIVAALKGAAKGELLDKNFYDTHYGWFGERDLHPKVVRIAEGSYQRRNGYEDGIRGKGYIVLALEAALWAFWATESFEEGALKAVNLGDDTDTTAAIYGQLAGAHYGYENIPQRWREQLYARDFVESIALWLHFLGKSDRQERRSLNAAPEKRKESRREQVQQNPVHGNLPSSSRGFGQFSDLFACHRSRAAS